MSSVSERQPTLRPATPDDAPRIAQLIASLRSQLTFDAQADGSREFLVSMEAPALRANLEAPNFSHFVAEQDGELLGVIAVRDRSHLFHLFVAAQRQGQGLSRKLWNLARLHAEAQGASGEFTVNSSPFARAVYERFGFRATAPPTTKHGVTYVPMRLEKDASRVD